MIQGNSVTLQATRKNEESETIFTCEQLNRLESEFADQQYMVGTERQQLAEALNLSETQVKFLFYCLFHLLKCQMNLNLLYLSLWYYEPRYHSEHRLVQYKLAGEG